MNGMTQQHQYCIDGVVVVEINSIPMQVQILTVCVLFCIKQSMTIQCNTIMNTIHYNAIQYHIGPRGEWGYL